MSFWNTIFLQDALNSNMIHIIDFHDYLMMVIIMILSLVGYFIFFILVLNLPSSSLVSDHLVESVWTIFPMVVLVFLVYPSIYLLYLIDESSVEFLCSLKVVGHQWYWSYSMEGLFTYSYDSYLSSDSNIRLLDVDNRVLIPVQEPIRALITSGDVLHSWALPSLGVKMDAVPGRLNQFIFNVMMACVVHGQCSEICGVNHSFMPIVLEAVSLQEF